MRTRVGDNVLVHLCLCHQLQQLSLKVHLQGAMQRFINYILSVFESSRFSGTFTCGGCACQVNHVRLCVIHDAMCNSWDAVSAAYLQFDLDITAGADVWHVCRRTRPAAWPSLLSVAAQCLAVLVTGLQAMEEKGPGESTSAPSPSTKAATSFCEDVGASLWCATFVLLLLLPPDCSALLRYQTGTLILWQGLLLQEPRCSSAGSLYSSPVRWTTLLNARGRGRQFGDFGCEHVYAWLP